MRIIKNCLHGAGIAEALIRNAPKAILPFESRRRSRQKINLDNGEPVGLVLKQGTVLRDGDILVTEDGQFVLVQAAIESVSRVTSHSPRQLTRAAYHLGNRHIPLEVGTDYLQLEYDPVLIDMLEQLGGITVSQVNKPFEPDAGAYGGGHKHGHDETFAEDYALAQAAYAAHEAPGDPAQGHSQAHSHDHSHEHYAQQLHSHKRPDK